MNYSTDCGSIQSPVHVQFLAHRHYALTTAEAENEPGVQCAWERRRHHLNNLMTTDWFGLGHGYRLIVRLGDDQIN